MDNDSGRNHSGHGRPSLRDEDMPYFNEQPPAMPTYVKVLAAVAAVAVVALIAVSVYSFWPRNEDTTKLATPTETSASPSSTTPLSSTSSTPATSTATTTSVTGTKTTPATTTTTSASPTATSTKKPPLKPTLSGRGLGAFLYGQDYESAEEQATEHEGVGILEDLENCRSFGTDDWNVVSVKEPNIDWLVYTAPGVPTEVGISIGSTLEELTSEYPDAQTVGTDNYYVVPLPGPSDMAFTLESDKVISIEVASDNIIAMGASKEPCA